LPGIGRRWRLKNDSQTARRLSQVSQTEATEAGNLPIQHIVGLCRSWPVVISVGSRAFELSFSAQKRGVQWEGGREDQAGVESRTMVIGASAMEKAALSSAIRTSTCAMEEQYHPPSPAKTQVKTARTRSNITVVTVDRTFNYDDYDSKKKIKKSKKIKKKSKNQKIKK
jgi:hypothetical protein